MGRMIGKSITPWGKMCKSQMCLKNITLEELAEAVGLSKNYTSAVINGRVVAPQSTLDKIGRELGISM